MRLMRLSRTAWLVLGIGIFVIAFGGLYFLNSRQGDEEEQLDDSLSEAQAALPKVISEKEDWESQLTQLDSQLTQLESQVAQAMSLLTQRKMLFPESVESIEYDERLFQIADGSNLEIAILTASEPGDETVEVEVEDIEVEGITYSVTSFVVNVRGKALELPLETEEELQNYIDATVDNILAFITTIVTDKDFTTATVELVNIDIPELLTDEEIEEIEESFTGELLQELTDEELTEAEREELLEALETAEEEAKEEIKERQRPSATIGLVIYGYKGE